MALATNSTPGSIVLAGDLTGTATAPELRPSGVIPGTYGPVNIIVDAKGRIVWAKASDYTADIMPLVPIASYTEKGICHVYETVGECDPQLLIVDGELRPNMRVATTTKLGKVQANAVHPSALEIIADGELKVKYGDANTFGIVRPGNGLTVVNGELQLGDTQLGEFGPIQIQNGGGISVTGGVISYTYGDAGYGGDLGFVTTASSTGPGLFISNGVLDWSAPPAPIASVGVPGYVSIGSNINVNAGEISLSVAGVGTKGVVSIGSGLDNSTGALSLAATGYDVPGLTQVLLGGGIQVNAGVIRLQPASNTLKGVVSVGSNISVNAGGEISVATGAAGVKGVVSVGSNISVNAGEISIPNGAAGVKGVVSVGSNISVNAGGEISVDVASTTTKGIAQIDAGLTASAGVVDVDSTVLRRSSAGTTTVAQTKIADVLSGTNITPDGAAGNIKTITTSGSTTLNNMSNVSVGAYYHVIISGSDTFTYGSNYKFKSGAQQQPIGAKSVLSMYAVDANTLYCIMQPNFV